MNKVIKIGLIEKYNFFSHAKLNVPNDRLIHISAVNKIMIIFFCYNLFIKKETPLFPQNQ